MDKDNESEGENTEALREDSGETDFVIQVDEPGARVWSELWEMRQDSTLCDVILTGYDQINVYAHSEVLSEASSMLRDTMSGQSHEGHITLQLPDLGCSVINAMLNFLYLGKLTLSQNDLEELNLAATILKIERLEKICSFLNGEAEDQTPTNADDSISMDVDLELVQDDSVSIGATEVKEKSKVVETSDGATDELIHSDISEPFLVDSGIESTVTTEGDNLVLGSPIVKSVVINSESDQAALHLIKEENDNHNGSIHESIMNVDINVDRTQVDIQNATFEEEEEEETVQDIRTNKPRSQSMMQNDKSTSNDFGLMTIEYEMQNKQRSKPDYIQTAYVKVDGTMGREAPIDPNTIKDIILRGSGGKKGQDITFERQQIDVYDCRIKGCKREFSTLSELRIHRRAKHSPADYQFECEICGRTFKYKHNVKHHMERHLDRVFGCTECNKSFFTRQDLLMHMRVHTGQKPFRCDFCNKSFSQGCNLLKHKRSVHNEEFMGGKRPHECPECLKCFKTQDMLHKHIKRHEQRLTCAMCNAEFRLRKELVKHQKEVHNMAFMPAKEESSLDVFKCSTCDKDFLSLKRLTLHQETVHEKTKRYACPYPSCKYRAFYRYAIDRHFQKHAKTAENVTKRLICDHCGEKFTAKRDLLTHIREKICREDEVPEHKKLYACVVCNTKFYSVSALQKHQDVTDCVVTNMPNKLPISRLNPMVITEDFTKEEILKKKHLKIKSQPAEENEEYHECSDSGEQNDSTNELLGNAPSQSPNQSPVNSNKKIFCHIDPKKTNAFKSVSNSSVIKAQVPQTPTKVVSLVPAPGKKKMKLMVVKGKKPSATSPKVVVINSKTDLKALMAGTTAV